MTTSGPALSFVLLPVAQRPTEEGFSNAWREVFGDLPPPSAESWEGESVFLDFDGNKTFFSLMPVPIPNGEADDGLSRSLGAISSKAPPLREHVAHLLVGSLPGDLSPYERLLRHTKVVAALAKAANAVGVYEGNAGATHEPDFYIELAAGGPELGVMLWNGISVARTSETIEILTLGMSQFDLPDLLLVAPLGEASDALPFAFDLLNYVIGRGSPIPKGETVGRTAEEKIPVAYVRSPIDSKKKVMRVDLTGRKKRWWQFGKN